LTATHGDEQSPLFNKLSLLQPGEIKTGVEILAKKLKFPSRNYESATFLDIELVQPCITPNG
jgi:hypothetical protein